MQKLFLDIQKFLLAPYQKVYSWKNNLRNSFLAGLFVGLFLLAFLPFGLGRAVFPYKTVFILGFGLVTFLISFIDELALNLLFRKKNFKIWQIIVLDLLMVGLIASGNYVYLRIWSQGRWETGIDFGTMLLSTLLVGLFPISFALLFQYIRVLGLQTNLEKQATPSQSPVSPLSLYSDQTKDRFESSTEEVLYLEASDNYTAIFYQEGEQIRKKLLRISLAEILKQLPDEFFFRCHRSYIVNLRQIDQVQGKAQGLLLQLHKGAFRVPVSRRNISGLKKRLG